MSVNKNFVVKNGIEVANNLLFASSSIGKVGIGSTVPSATLEVFGGTKSGDGFFSGILTSVGSFDVGPDGSAFYVDPSTSKVGINTTASGYTLNVNAPSGALISGGDLTVNNTVSVGGTIDAVRIEVGSATTITSGKVDVTGTVDATTGDFVNLNSTGVGTIATLDTDTGSIDYLTSGVGTIGNVKISSGIVTASTGIVTYYGDGQYLANIVSGVGIRTAGSIVGYGITLLDFRGAGVSTITAPSAGISTINIVGGGGNGGSDPSYTSINVSGIATIGTVEISSGIITSTSGGIVTYYGDGSNLTGSAPDFIAGSGISSNSTYVGTGVTLFNFIGGDNVTVDVAKSSTTADITINSSSNIDVTEINVSGVATVGVITGTASIGVTAVYAETLYGDASNVTGIVTSVVSGDNIVIVNGTVGVVTVSLYDLPSFAGIDVAGIATVATLSSGSVSAQTISGTNGSITNLTGTAATITTLNSTTGTITNATLTNATITNLTGTISTIGTIDVANATVTNISGSIGTYTEFNGTDLTFTNGTITNGNVTNLNSTNINSSGITTLATLDVQSNFDVYDSQATFHNDLYVAGNVTIGGTTSSLNAVDLKITDKDIVLGVTTDSNGEDISTDDTANHGGIAVASTEGNPLIDLRVVGLETLPPTYKKIMWFKAGTFSGLGTDAWITNYAVGIGSTQFPTGTRFASGSVQFTDNTINTPQLVVSGVATAQDFNSLSDIKYKENINTVNDALLKVDQLRGVSFDWKRTGSPSYGVIAQELEQVLPELVHGSDPRTVNYNGIIGVLIEAVKELKREVDQLKNHK